MPITGTGTSTRTAVARRRNGHATAARSSDAREEAISGCGRGAGRGAPEKPEAAALCGLLRGLRAGDLESVLLTVAMAAEENRMPSADPDEAERILAFLARLAEHDAALPPDAGGSGGGQKPTWDGIDADDAASAR